MKGPTFGQSVSSQVCSKSRSFMFRDRSADMQPAATPFETLFATLLEAVHQVLGESRCPPTHS